MSNSPAPAVTAPALSVVIPFYNEEENVEAVSREVRDVLGAGPEGGWELVMVNDGSKDGTAALIDALAKEDARFRGVHLTPNSGQSAALEAGFRAARGELIATLDGDGQNDPRDIMPVLAELRRRNVDMMCGIRAKRADNWVRRVSSKVANGIRARVLGDNISDVGCSLRVFKRSCVRNVGFFRNAHRYFPALFQIRGYSVAEMPVNHRIRAKGVSKYGGGISSRLWVGIVDLTGVAWLKRRALRYTTRETGGGA